MFENLHSVLPASNGGVPIFGREDTRSDYTLIENSIRTQRGISDPTKAADAYVYASYVDEIAMAWIYNNKLFVTGDGQYFSASTFTEQGLVQGNTVFRPGASARVGSKYYARPFQFGRYGVIIGSRSQKHFFIYDMETETGIPYPDLKVVNASPLIIDDVIYVFGGFDDVANQFNRTIIYSRSLGDTTSPWTETEVDPSEMLGLNHDFFKVGDVYYGFQTMSTNSDTNFNIHSGSGYRPLKGYVIFDPANMTLTDVPVSGLTGIPNTTFGAATSYDGEKFYFRYDDKKVTIDPVTNVGTTQNGFAQVAGGHTQGMFHTPRIAIRISGNTVYTMIVVD